MTFEVVGGHGVKYGARVCYVEGFFYVEEDGYCVSVLNGFGSGYMLNYLGYCVGGGESFLETKHLLVDGWMLGLDSSEDHDF